MIAEPGEEGIVETNEAGVVGPFSFEVKSPFLKTRRLTLQADVFPRRPPSARLEIAQISHALFLDLHDAAAGAIGGDEVVRSEHEIKIHHIAKHRPRAIQPVPSVDD